MLKSTYKPSPATAATNTPLPPGWSEHKAPTGHTYYYNTTTKTSTYIRPGVPPPATQPAAPVGPVYPVLATPVAANAFMASVNPDHFKKPEKEQGKRNEKKYRLKSQPIDRPRTKRVIPGHEGWFLVDTKYGRRFVYNTLKDASYWRVPEKLKGAIKQMDEREARRKAGIPEPEEEREEEYSEYEEVEVTDDEGAEVDNEESEPFAKRARTKDMEMDEGPVEFTEADIMAQLTAMDGEVYEGEEYYDEGEEALSKEDAEALFRDLLSDFRTSPYSPWDIVISNSTLIEDPRYTALSTTRDRKSCWDAWSRDEIAKIKERRSTEEKADPKLAYIAFLEENATTKLFWPEFKRKYRKEDVMTNRGLQDKEREKMYREFVSRLKMSTSTQKSDLVNFLKGVSISVLNNQSSIKELPAAIRGDIRYAAVSSSIRDPIVSTLIGSLGPPLKSEEGESEEAIKERESRRRREKALKDNERRAEESRRWQQRALEASKGVLREKEKDIQEAMRVGRKGIRSQLDNGTE